MVEAARLPAASNIIVNLSGRGDKDLGIVSRFQRGTSGGKDKLS